MATQLGYATDMVTRKVLVGTSPTLIVNANPLRRYLLLQNQGTKLMNIGFGTPAQADNGLQLGILGASENGDIGARYEMSTEKGNLTRQAVYASTSVAGNILVMENSPAPAPPADISSSSSSSSTAAQNSSSSSTASSASSASSESSSSSTAAQNSSSSSTASSASSSSSSSP